ncbi:MAG: alanine dehydrogenase, partial [Sphingomonadales bacterium 39-62-4]
MRVGTVKEIKNHEYRVGLTPESARELVANGNEVWVETGAGNGIGATDADYEAAGASIKADAKTLFDGCEMIVKVKEPQAVERAML